VTSSGRAAISRSMCAVTFAWKHGASRHYVESGQLASIFRWLATAALAA
jgi:hypothetical protein